jgi:ribose transport system permease protein
LSVLDQPLTPGNDAGATADATTGIAATAPSIDAPSQAPLVEGDSKTIRAVLFLLEGGPLIILAILVVGLWAFTQNHVFMSYGNIGNVLEQSAGVCIIAIGQLFVILTRGIDLSIGSNISLSCIVCLVVFHDTKSPTQAIVYTLLTGLAIGLVNGIVLVKGRLPHPFIATLATLSVCAGLALYIQSSTIVGAPWLVDKLGGDRIKAIGGAGKIGWFPWAAVVVVAFAAICWVILHKLVWGRWIYAVGGSPEAAIRTGVPHNSVLVSVYVVSGLSGAIGALLFVGSANAASPLTGQGMELQAIAAVIIGGGSFLGGRGSVLNALTGALILGVVHNGLNLLGYDPNWQYIATGVVIVLAVELDVIRAFFENKFRSLQARIA